MVNKLGGYSSFGPGRPRFQPSPSENPIPCRSKNREGPSLARELRPAYCETEGRLVVGERQNGPSRYNSLVSGLAAVHGTFQWFQPVLGRLHMFYFFIFSFMVFIFFWFYFVFGFILFLVFLLLILFLLFHFLFSNTC